MSDMQSKLKQGKRRQNNKNVIKNKKNMRI